MSEAQLFNVAVGTEIGLAGVTLVLLLFVTAPYGRAVRAGWGPSMPSTLGWVIMESPAVLLWLAIFAQGQHRAELLPLVLLGLWQLHYVHRAFIYPFRMRMAGKRMPVVIALSAVVFNVLNAYVNARWVSHFAEYGQQDLLRPTFIAGVALFVLGLGINLHSDEVLRRLRAPGETGYKIPQGGLHRWVASPNYFGEVLEWSGWALAVGGVPGWAFAIYTFANLAPRARSHLRWYRSKFKDYPEQRRALIPFVW